MMIWNLWEGKKRANKRAASDPFENGRERKRERARVWGSLGISFFFGFILTRGWHFLGALGIDKLLALPPGRRFFC